GYFDNFLYSADNFENGMRKVTTTVWKAGEFIKEGETASATILRLSSSLKEVNTWFSYLNNTLLEVSLKGGDVASKLL
ncbi:hypothetical protein, partial [Helicobacter pylori]|uniref:hypothetical protein n=1 Tax=Helicobacter pylori TaxID=210 RepID=UPI002928A96E